MNDLVQALRSRSHPLGSLEPLYKAIDDCEVVLLGEASHGTSEYYTWRARISQHLIREKGFRFIAVEGDWPDCYELNRYVKGRTDRSLTARDVLHKFDRWPTWMWANWEVVALAEWLREFNRDKPEDQKVGFYGLDVYSLWESLAVVYGHLKEHHPQKLEEAMQAISCFEPFNRDAQEYAWHTRFAIDDCADEVVDLLRSLRSTEPKYPDDPESHFDAEQNALVAVNAERYYRAMVSADNESWNIRDIHMADTLDRLLEFHGRPAKGIVWEHNTHIGDARATDMAEAGMVNIGQLARERHRSTFLVGFGSYQGTVIAGKNWGAPMEVMQVPQARETSWEGILHQVAGEDRLLVMDDVRDIQEAEDMRGHRAIGVVYRPEYERMGNYVPTDLSRRYDAFLFLEKTMALHPLHLEEHAGPEPPETYPWGV
jgi:erythromycin esterase-like protein